MKKKILVVDDESDIVKTTAIALELDGYAVYTAATGVEAIATIRRCSPDLVIIDMILPEMSGKDVVRWIKRSPEYQHVPVILITALAQKSEKEALEEENIDSYLIKPFDLGHLERKVKELLRAP
jgi:DNA-binding response OmpR family regulator